VGPVAGGGGRVHPAINAAASTTARLYFIGLSLREWMLGGRAAAC